MSRAVRRGPRLLLGRRMTLVVAGTASVLAIGYMVAGIWFAKVQLEREFEQSSELATASLASSLIEAMITYDLHRLPDLLDNTAKSNPTIRYGFVTDIDGNPVARTGSLPDGVPGDLQRLAQDHARGQGNAHSYVLRTEDGDVLHIVYPLEGRPGGFLHLGFSLNPVDAKLHITARHLVASMSVGLLLAALAGGLVYRRMAQPILELTSAAADLGAGNLSRRVMLDALGQDEASLLGSAFNQMADRLEGKLTELETSRRELADEQTRVQAILDGMMHGVIFYDPDGTIGYLNSTAKRHWAVGANPPASGAMLHADEPEAVRALELAAHEPGGVRLQVRRGERTYELYFSALHAGSGAFLGMIEISADITEELAAARSLAHAEKLNVVGQLAAGVAHEINSPLDGALDTARMFERGELTGAEVQQFGRVQRIALERIAAIITRLLTFSRLPKAGEGASTLGAALFEAMELIKYRQKNSSLTFDYPDPAGLGQPIKAPALELSQVFVNLLGNAIDASPEGGRIKVEVEETPEWLLTAVIDQGPGIPAEYEPRLFTPFFTTKEVGKGTGLGLAISKNIIEKMGGRIEFRNEAPGGGARFTVRLPRDGPPAPSPASEERSP